MKKPKTDKKYIVLDDGQDYRKIARIMSKSGFKMNHATARNIYVDSMRNFIKELADGFETPMSDERVEEILMEDSIHPVFMDILFNIYKREGDLLKK